MIIASLAFGAPYVVIVALKPIAADFGGHRSIPSAAASLVMLGTGVGGLPMSWLAERIGVRSVVAIGGLMVCAGLVLSSHASDGFDRRRGTALALIRQWPIHRRRQL